jgi:hypothetical protein
MHAVLHILEFWALAFVSLSATLVLLNIFWDLIEQDLCLKTFGKEAVIAGIASFIEAIGLWLIIKFVPTASLAMILPGLLVGLIYKIAHFENWGHYEIICLLFFQLVLSLVGTALLTGHFAMAIPTVIIFAVALAVVIAFVKGL